MTTDYRGIVTRRAAEIGTNEGKPGSTAACLQSVEELIWLAPFIDRLKPKVILEIGIYKGGWQWVMCPFYEKGASIIGIDSMQRHQQDNGEAELDEMLARLKVEGHTTEMFRGRSNDEKVQDAVHAFIDGITGNVGPVVDLLHIDGAHDYFTAAADFYFYSRFVRRGGLVVLHDIATQTSQMNVKQLWDEIKLKAVTCGSVTYETCVEAGIGVVMI